MTAVQGIKRTTDLLTACSAAEAEKEGFAQAQQKVHKLTVYLPMRDNQNVLAFIPAAYALRQTTSQEREAQTKGKEHS